jgi:polyisoprenoid-binding protein YceI
MPMRKFHISAVASLIVLPLIFSQQLQAGWTLDGATSNLYYVTSKAAAVSELNSFEELSGNIADDGSASVSIMLGSVDTAIDIRNERMREIVFQVETYPLATVSLSADAMELNSLSAGDSIRTTYEAILDLHGIVQTLSLDVVVTGLKGGGLQVVLARPLILNAASFGFADEVEQLREIAGLPSINNNVVVDFTLQFDAD